MGATLYNLLQKMRDSDPDFRIVATDDLMKALVENNLKIVDTDEREVVQAVMRLLADTNGEVQNRAVQCLATLIPRIRDQQIMAIIKELCRNMMVKKKGSEQLRDVSIMGIKGLIQQLPATSSAANEACQDLAANLMAAITEEKDHAITLEALDVLGEVLGRYGTLLANQHKALQDTLLAQLTHSRPAIRKRAIAALARLVPVEADQLFNSLVETLIARLTSSSDDESIQTCVQCITAINRNVGHRVGRFLPEIFPVLETTVRGSEDVELIENCLQCMESFVLRCPNEVGPYLQKCTVIGLDYLGWDPNYEGMSGDEDEDMENGDESDNDDDQEDEEEWDDDMSWKVRRAASKLLCAIAASRPELLPELYATVVPRLIQRFKEREENVRLDIFHTMQVTLRTTKLVSQARDAQDDLMDVGDGPLANLSDLVPAIVKGVTVQLKDKNAKSMKTKQACFQLLKELVGVLPRCLSDHALLRPVLEGVAGSLQGDKANSNLKMDALAFLYILLSTHPASVIQPHAKQLVDPVCVAVTDHFYKTASEGLLVCTQLVRSLRPLDDSGASADFDFAPYAKKLVKAVNERFVVTDVDQEVKDRAIGCMARIIANMGDALTSEVQSALPHLLKRLQNEITRVTAIRGLILIAESPLRPDISTIMDSVVAELTLFLRKENRTLRLASVTCLAAVIQNYGGSIGDDLMRAILVELPSMINDQDLQVAECALNLATRILRVRPQLVADVESQAPVLPATLTLLQSALLQGGALKAVLDFFTLLSTARGDSQGLLAELTAPVYGKGTGPGLAVSRQAFTSIAKCIGVVVREAGGNIDQVVKQFLADIKKPQSSESVKLLALLAIGEIGCTRDLSSHVDLSEVIEGAFSCPSEDVKAGAAHALGLVCAGNLGAYLPIIINEIRTQPKRQYMLLHSLKEAIQMHASTPEGTAAMQPFVGEMWGMLFDKCEMQEEGMRNVVADCLGKMTLMDPGALLPRLLDRLESQEAYVRSTVVTAVKFTVTDKPHPIDKLLRPVMERFLSHIQDPDLNVRRVALITLNSVAHNKPALIAAQLQNILPLLYAETQFKPELVRKVQVGPFPVEFDDGEDIRKAAYECMYTLLDYCVSMMVMDVFITHVIAGMKDRKDDIQMLAHLMLVRLATIMPSAVLQRLDEIVDSLQATITRKPGQQAIKQEIEKLDDLIRSAMRVLLAVKKMPDAETNTKLGQLLVDISATKELQDKMDMVQRDQDTGRSQSDAMDLS